MINIEVPASYLIERSYILEVIFEEFLGLKILVKVGDRSNTKISIDDRSQLIIADGLFAIADHKWLTQESLPKQPLKIWNPKIIPIKPKPINNQIPVIYGDDPNKPTFFSISESEIYLGLDIFGSAFFMLTRYEEVVKPDRDRHDRFPAKASLAYQEGFLDRPIINEYLEILWSCLLYLCPKLQRKLHSFSIDLTHDVDIPYYYAFMNGFDIARHCSGHILKRKSWTKAFASLQTWTQVKSGNIQNDPFNTFDSILNLSEKYQLKSAFFFITDHSSENMDGNYEINHPLIQNLMKEINERGHEIGLHCSNNTYQNSEQTTREFEILKRECERLGIKQDIWGGRQHYLRWQCPETFQNWEDAGLNYDSTLSYADYVGFRCGTCYEFSTYNLYKRKKLLLKEKPLILMECSLIRESYMGKGLDFESLEIALELKSQCIKHGGLFTILWHNSSLTDRREIIFLENLLMKN